MKRASSGHGKNGVSRLELRKAVMQLKAKRTVAAKKSGHSPAKVAPASFVERYLGHFGVGNSSPASQFSAAKKANSAKTAKSAKKASSKKNAPSRGVRRAS
jgi:hypothetical protein